MRSGCRYGLREPYTAALEANTNSGGSLRARAACHQVPGAVHVDLAGQSRIAIRGRRDDRRQMHDRVRSMALHCRGDRVGVGEVGVFRDQLAAERCCGQVRGGGRRTVAGDVHCDHRAPAAQQDFGAPLTDLAEGAGDEDGLAVHRLNLRAIAAPASRKLGEMRTEKTGLNTSSRSRVRVDVLISHRPSTFS